MVGLESIRCSNIVVFGKARKIVGGEGSKRPFEVLSRPLEPLDKPPHPLKLGEVLDWTVSYADPPCVWLVTLRAWYRLGEPSAAYLRTFAPMHRRVNFVAVTAAALREDWNLTVEAALRALAEVPVVPGDLLDPKFRGIVAANDAAREKVRKDAETAAAAAGAHPDVVRAEGEKAAAECHEVAPLRYAERDIVEDCAFVGRHVDALRLSGALAPGDALSSPPLARAFKTLLEETKRREAIEAKIARKNAQRAAHRAAARERLQAARGGREISAKPAAASAVPLKPREPRLAPPPEPDSIIPESYRASPALVAETLALWDLTQVHGGFLQLPPCPWLRFRRAFLAPNEVGSEDGPTPADAALVRDVCVALMRAYEGGGLGPDGRPNARPKETRDSAAAEEPEDLAALDWTERAGAALSVWTAGDGGGPLGAGPATWTSVAVKEGATAAAKRLAVAERGSKTALDLPPKERVALAAALSCAACDAEAWGEHLKAKTESTRAAHNMGHLPLAPRRAKPKPDGTGVGGAGDASAATAKRPDWAETLIEWVRKASDRESFLRHRPIARDETGRAYHVLGGSAGAGMLFVQRPTREEEAARRTSPDSDDEADVPAPAGAGAEGVKIEGENGPAALAPAALSEEEKSARREAKVRTIAAESRASLKNGKARGDAFAASGAFDDWPTRWSCFTVGPTLKALKDWLDDDPRNPKAADERRLKSIAALLMKTAKSAEPAPTRDAGGDEKMKTEAEIGAAGAVEIGAAGAGAHPDPDPNVSSTTGDAFDEYGLREDGYARLDDWDVARAEGLWVPGISEEALLAAERDRAATALCGVVRHVLSGASKFWTQTPPWLSACLNLTGALPDALGTGLESVARGDSAGDRLSVLVARVLPPLEALLRASNAMQPEWLERREAWFTGLKGAEDFDLRVPPPQLMTYEEAEAAVAAAAVTAAEAIEWSTTDEALAAATKLSVARSARLLATLCSALAPDPLRLNREQFLAATPSATHAGVLACQPGSVVALLRKGMKLTRERYLDMRAAPEGWIPLRELRPVERAVVRAVAYRGAVPPPPEYPDISGTPPCCWVLLELLDPGMIIPGRRKSGEAPREGPRLVSAPVFAGGEIADYLIPWEKYATAAERPWAKGARIQMFFEDLTAGADPNAPGALPLPEPIVAKAEENGTANGANAADGAVGDVEMSEAAGADGSGAEAGTDATAAAAPAATPAKEEKVGIIKGENGAEYWLGRVNRVRGGDDPWENTQVIFDSDPDGEEPMWVCPWEIELAPEEYQPKDEDYRPFGAAGGGGGAEEERSQADQAKVDAGQAIAERLGWPQGTAAARAEFNTWRQAANPDGTLPRSAPVFCRAELDLYRVLVEVMCLGGYELVTEEKRWKQVARTLGKDLTTQTSASFALRNNYQRYLLEFEMWLWDNADTLGPRPEEFSLPTPAATPVKQPLTFTARVQPAMDTMDEEGEEDEERVSPEDDDDDFKDDDDDDDTDEKEVPAGEEDFDPDAESDEGEEDDESDEDFAIRPTSASKGKKRARAESDSDEDYA